MKSGYMKAVLMIWAMVFLVACSSGSGGGGETTPVASSSSGTLSNNAGTNLTPQAYSLDVNADGVATPQDAIVILRYLSLVTGPALTAGVVTGGQRTDPAAIKEYLDGARTTMLDVNKDGAATPQDAIVILRYLSLVSGPALTAGVITGGDQTDPTAIEQFLKTYMPVAGVFTYHNDNARTGQNLNEKTLTWANVNQAQFGMKFSYPLDGIAYASPLYVPNVLISGQGVHNIVYVATEHDSVYAFDADGLSPNPLWHVSLIPPGETTVPAADTGEIGDIAPVIGITGTPVIDPNTGTLYVVAKTKVTNNTTYVQRLHALDITTGAEKFGGPVAIQPSVPGIGDGNDGKGNVPFNALRENQRPALLLSNGVVYIGFASHGDNGPYHGWVLGYDATTLQPVMAYNNTPNGGEGGIWQSGGGLAADSAGNIYFVAGNGTFDANTPGGVDYGESVEKISPGGLALDFFTPHDQVTLSAGDLDLGSGAALLLPDQSGAHPHLLVTAGKNGTIYLIDRDNMGHFNPNNDNQIVQSLVNIFPNPDGSIGGGNFSTGVYFNGFVYFCPVDGSIQAFQLSNGLLSTAPTSQSSATFAFPGGMLAISANGTTNGILWAVERIGEGTPGVFHAYKATDLGDELYNGNLAGSDPTAKFNIPLVANGKVYVASVSQLTVFGLLP